MLEKYSLSVWARSTLSYVIVNISQSDLYPRFKYISVSNHDGLIWILDSKDKYLLFSKRFLLSETCYMLPSQRCSRQKLAVEHNQIRSFRFVQCIMNIMNFRCRWCCINTLFGFFWTIWWIELNLSRDNSGHTGLFRHQYVMISESLAN